MQLKENVSRRRRMGTDITNKEQQPRESHEPKKASKITITTQHDTSSPRMALTEVPKTKPASPLQTNNVPPKTLEVQDKTRLPTVQEEEPQGYKKQRKSVNKSKKPENFKSRLVKTMQEEPFVRSPATSNNNNHNKSNNLLLTQGDKSSLSINDIASFKSVPSLHTIIKKKDSSPHKSSKLQVEASSSRNRASTEPPRFQSQSSSSLEYITRTLRRTGIDRDTPISYAKWFSPSHPLDPSIFYFLEHFAVTSTRPRNSLSLRSNRKLLFHLVDEILADILKPQINPKTVGLPLPDPIAEESQRIGADRRVESENREVSVGRVFGPRDIDSLVAGDFPETSAAQSGLAFEEEGEGIVAEIERGILEALVIETTTDCYDTWVKTAPLKRNDDVSGTWGVHVTRCPSNAGSHHDSWLRLQRG
ncbi:Uncharacterized protein Rs2_24242 [Raphanus sativus]|nr:Uncharacterized protein Rs2_24242 [Raphanus sativus]